MALIMAQGFFFSLILSIFCINSAQCHASNVPLFAPPSELMPETCDAPAPDSFNVANIGAGFVDVTWAPVWTGATYTILVYRQNNVGGWNNYASYSNIAESSFSIPVTESGSYKARISTQCATGETSIYHAEVEYKVIELTTVGRIPYNPQPINGCESIDMHLYNWVGFRVSKIGTGISNLFEITMDGKVKRVYDPTNPHQIVAVNSDDLWPINLNDTKKVYDTQFKMMDLLDGNPTHFISIGYVQFFELMLPNVMLCKSETPQPWKNEYSFTALTAASTVIYSPGFAIDPGDDTESVKITNPFSEELNVFVPHQQNIQETAYHIQLFNLSGQLLFSQTMAEEDGRISLPTNTLPSGVYFVQVKSPWQTHAFRALKAK